MGPPIEPISFDEYDKISDDLITFANGRFKFEVNLARYDAKGTRKSFYSEVKYNMSGHLVRKINRKFSYQIVIESYQNAQDSKVYIREKDMILFKTKLKYIISNWLSNRELWQERDGYLHVVGQYTPVVITGLHDKYIRFDPATMRAENEEVIKAIRLSLNGDFYYIDMDLDKYMELVSIMDTLSMYQCAITMLNYLDVPLGSNTFDNSAVVKYEAEPDPLSMIIDNPNNGFKMGSRKRREIITERRGNFFDKKGEKDDTDRTINGTERAEGNDTSGHETNTDTGE